MRIFIFLLGLYRVPPFRELPTMSVTRRFMATAPREQAVTGQEGLITSSC